MKLIQQVLAAVVLACAVNSPASAIQASEVPPFGVTGIGSNNYFDGFEFKFLSGGTGSYTTLRSTQLRPSGAGIKSTEAMTWSISPEGLILIVPKTGLSYLYYSFVTDDQGNQVQTRRRNTLTGLTLELGAEVSLGRRPSILTVNGTDQQIEPTLETAETYSSTERSEFVANPALREMSAVDIAGNAWQMPVFDVTRSGGTATGNVGTKEDVLCFAAGGNGVADRSGIAFTWALTGRKILTVNFADGTRGVYRTLREIGDRVFEVSAHMSASDGTEFHVVGVSARDVEVGYGCGRALGFFHQHGIGTENPYADDPPATEQVSEFSLEFRADGTVANHNVMFDAVAGSVVHTISRGGRYWRVEKGLLISERGYDFVAEAFCDPRTVVEGVACTLIDRRTQQLVRREGDRHFVRETRAINFGEGGIAGVIPDELARWYDRTDAFVSDYPLPMSAGSAGKVKPLREPKAGRSTTLDAGRVAP